MSWGSLEVRSEVPNGARVETAVTSPSRLAGSTRPRKRWALRDQDTEVATLASAAGRHRFELHLTGLVEGERDGRRVRHRLRGGSLCSTSGSWFDCDTARSSQS